MRQEMQEAKKIVRVTIKFIFCSFLVVCMLVVGIIFLGIFTRLACIIFLDGWNMVDL